MNFSTYQSDDRVADFVTWMTPFVASDRAIQHQWSSPSRRFRRFSCSTLFEAYTGYDWPFSVVLPGHMQATRGSSYHDTEVVFWELSHLLRESAARKDDDAFASAVKAVMAWGGLRQSWRGLEEKREKLLLSVVAAAKQLEPDTADTRQLDSVTLLNSGFSKVYALLLDGFPIYDSRVACALASFVVRYCEEQQLVSVPAPLEFGIPASRSTARDPSRGLLKFPKLRYGQPRAYANSNLKTAWLLRLLGDIGPFGQLPSGERVLAIQSAFFMLGYTKLSAQAFD